MSKGLVSVIVPIYNVETYLHKCVDSIINQTYKNLEIILVDDGSPDNCPQICDDYSKKDNRIKVIHKENGGLSDARNAGMAVATGEYISFIDSDDYIAEDFYEVLLSAIISHESDIAECSVVKFYDDGRVDTCKDSNAVSDFNTVDGLSALIRENPFRQHVWNKLYKTHLVKDVPFEKGKLNEDEFWTYQIFGKAKKVTKADKTMYYYLQRSSSIMGVSFNLKRLDALEGKFNRQVYIEQNYPTVSLESKIDFYNSCMYSYQCVLKFMRGKEKRQGIKIINKYRKKCSLSFQDIKSANKDLAKYLYLAKFNFYICCKIRAALNIGF